jgi:hypothetical protein
MVIRALDLFLSTAVGIGSDHCHTSIGKRFPFLLVGEKSMKCVTSISQHNSEVHSSRFSGVPCLVVGLRFLIDPIEFDVEAGRGKAAAAEDTCLAVQLS